MSDFYCDEVLSGVTPVEVVTETADVLAFRRDVLFEHGACRVATNLGDCQESKHLHWHVGAGEPLAAADSP